MKIVRIADRVPKPRPEPEPTPADLLRALLAARAPRTRELRRRLSGGGPASSA
jgi:hypothetical protein